MLKKRTNSEDSFLYHSGNVCYKPYVLSKAVSLLQDEEKTEDEDVGDMMIEVNKSGAGRSLRSPNSTRERPSSGKNVWKILCVICNQKTKDKVSVKHRLEKIVVPINFLKWQRRGWMLFISVFLIVP